MSAMNNPDGLAAELEADRGYNRDLDARIAVALYSDTGHTDPRDNTHARLPSKSDECAPGTYWVSAFSGLSLRTAPNYTSDQTLKRLALTALRAEFLQHKAALPDEVAADMERRFADRGRALERANEGDEG